VGNSLIDQIKLNVKISDVLNSYNKRVDCPSCNRVKTASIINNEFVYCYSASCGFKADVIGLNSLLVFGTKDRYKDSIKDLSSKFNIQHVSTIDKDKIDFYNDVSSVYITQLKDTSLNYLLNRHLSLDVIKTIGIGFASGTSLRAEFSRSKLLKYGLLSITNKEFFSNRIVFPLTSYRGDITSFVGRYIGESNDYIPRYKNLECSINTLVLENYIDLYNKDKMLCIAEGFVDTISLYQLGLQAVGILGVNGLLNYTSKLKEFKNICFCFDSDKDDEGNYKSYKQLIHQIVDLILINSNCKYYIYLPIEAKDINDLLCKSVITSKNVLQEKVLFIDFLMSLYINDHSKHVLLIKLIEVTNDDVNRAKFCDLIGKQTYNYVVKILDYYGTK
jgi:DNA primase